jgi:hypothetical protein
VSEEPYQRKRRFIRHRIPAYGVELNEVDPGFDAPYEGRDARFWWIVVGVIVVIAVIVGIGLAVGV